jgi:6-phosphogluconolactonase
MKGGAMLKARENIQIHDDAKAAARAGAEEFRSLARAAAAAGRNFAVALTGGDSPRELYRLLGTDEFAGEIPWERVHLFWGDDRCVPPDHPRSNFGMAAELFVDRVPIPRPNVHRMPAELGPHEGARLYEEELRSFFSGGLPHFDLVHLGVGDDGHIASLFPFEHGNLMERERWVLPALERELGERRVTLSLATINAAANVRMLLPDGEQKEMVRRLLVGPLDPFRLPAQLVRPDGGVQWWTLTRDSAAELPDRE